MEPTILKSNEDLSVNFVFGEKNNFLEARFVRRDEDYIVCYISVKKGCSKKCKFCFLTTTKQTNEEDATIEEILQQVQAVKNYYEEAVKSGKEKKARVVHFNFMARGEPLDSKVILEDNQVLFTKMAEIFSGLRPKFNISTIMPLTLKDKKLTDIFRLITPTIYYSLYSTNEDFRANWMPQAQPFQKALENLKEYQDDTKKIVKLHQALIKNENDSLEECMEIYNIIKEIGLLIEFQIVRYNPYSENEGEETSDIQMDAYVNQMSSLFPSFTTKILNRVGHDVNASCGMFYV